MTASRKPDPLPPTDAPTVRLRLVGTLPPALDQAPAPAETAGHTVTEWAPRAVPAAVPAPVAEAPAAPETAAPAPKPRPAPRPPKSLARRVARKILGPNLLTKRD